MASGNQSLELTEEGNWESFPQFAEEFTKQIGAKILQKIESVNIRIWEIEYEGVILNLVYDDFPNGITIEPKDMDGQAAIYKLSELVKIQSS